MRQHKRVIHVSALESRRLGFRPQLCCVLALSLSFLIRDMETTMLLMSSSHCEDAQLIQIAWDLVSAQDLILIEMS